MVENDDYDRAWERREAAQRKARRLEGVRPVVRRAIGVSALILLGLGVLLVALGAESFAALDACIADPLCLPMVPGGVFEESFGILAVGLVLSLVGAVQVAAGFRASPKDPTLPASL